MSRRITRISNIIDRQFIHFRRLTRKRHELKSSQARRDDLKNVKEFLDWITRHVINRKLYSKYGCRVRKIILDYSVDDTNVDVTFHSDQDSEEYKFARDVQIYCCKEKANMSDDAFRIFIQAGVKFPTMGFIFKCREVLGNKFDFHFNNKGKTIYHFST